MVPEISVSELRRKRVSELVDILQAKKLVKGWETKEYTCESGDGHSFNDSYSEEIIQHVESKPVNGWFVRRRAYKELKIIKKESKDPYITSYCNSGLNDEFRPTIPRAIKTSLEISVMIGFGLGVGYLGYQALVEPFMK